MICRHTAYTLWRMLQMRHNTKNTGIFIVSEYVYDKEVPVMKSIKRTLFLLSLFLLAALLSVPFGAEETEAASLSRPVIRSASVSSTGRVTLSWKKVKKASGYLIYRDGTKIKKISSASKLSYTDTKASAGTHSYTVKAYKGSKKSKASKKKTVTVTRSAGTTAAVSYKTNTKNVKASFAVEADLTLSGQGSGYHGKMMINSPTSAVSFGIQYDTACGISEYRSKKAFMYENVGSNDPGQQSYGWIGLAEAKKTYHLMIAYNNGVCSFYVDGKKVGSAKNTKLKSASTLGLVLEGSARKNGDAVMATFSNVRIRQNSIYYPSSKVSVLKNITGSGLSGTVNTSTGKITLYGTLKLGKSQDWDSAFNQVSAYAILNRKS